MASVRHPAVAGAFYPGDRQRLSALAAELVAGDAAPEPAIGAMVPHAGYVYSGRCAGSTLASVTLPRDLILLGPNHTGRGAALAAAAEESWSTPLGSVPVAQDLIEALAGHLPELERDARAHSAEHCLEVQLPLLQSLREDLRIAPIVVGTHDGVLLRRLGTALAALVRESDDAPLILVSSDMTHYESAAVAADKDRQALERLTALDGDGLLAVVREQSISMCGVAPATAAAHAFRELGVRRAETICYTHSGKVTGDEREVVAYAGMVFRA